MSERTVHAFTDSKGIMWEVVETPSGAVVGRPTRWDHLTPQTANDPLTVELARLAAENAKLRACVAAADLYREAGIENIGDCERRYDAARREVNL